MHPEIARLLEQAEQRYLQTNELELFRRYAVSLARRMETYEILRDKEEQIFQPVADRLVAAFPDERQDLLERSLKHWLLISRYCGTAMLLSDPDFLALRLKDWMTGLVQTHQTQTIERKLYELLLQGVKAELSDKHFPLIQPLFEKAKAILLEETKPQ
ncbi:phycobilisome protein [Laspinema olomoucense]|uniref:phycobilisome protein n=1 Tax=Laspinema olomoucense TaxID=3231600 RepID=UPI0021BAE8DE|nr:MULTISPECIES: phycobilisome protein [unclassified Laspinema]MCT7971529.1 phycobilisome protein [Laspinema sp. D3d]MCT7990947.1 phycobilisome protein [Laspinema sp. D3a]